LLVQGSKDVTVPPYLADEIFVGLRRLGKEVTYLRYTREGHWEGEWQYSDVYDEFQRIQEFLLLHFK
jgi:dipeptidyl aminopeptidase/acylaminoacyl peptidase